MFHFPGFAFDATIEQAFTSKLKDRSYGTAQVLRKVLGIDCMNEPKVNASFIAAYGRTDVVNTINDFIFTPASKSAFTNFTIVDDDVLEFDELLIAEFKFDPKIANTWNARKGEPSTTLILIRDDDCELFSNYAMTVQTQVIRSFVSNALLLSRWQFPILSVRLNCVAVEVNFNEERYTVAESDGQVSLSLRIDGKFFVPVWAIVEISNGTATGGCAYKCIALIIILYR